MAVAYGSVATTGFGAVSNGASMSITKPSGLAVGDILLAHLSICHASGGLGNWDTPSGWTALSNSTKTTNLNSKARLTVFYKVADSGDVAGGSFSFQLNTANSFCGGALYRITGGFSALDAAGTASDTGSPTFANTITPSQVNSLAIFLTTVADAGQTSGSVSNYAIVTDNPTWSEEYDFVGNDGTRRGLMAGATASRPQVTATGNSSCSYVNFAQNSIGVIVIIIPVVDGTGTPAVLEATFSIPAPDATGTAVATPATLIGTLSIPPPTPEVPVDDWSSPAKDTGSGDWSSPNKN